ncbi:SusC/RagA family TonB-linked outer membrane protein [Alistipes sp.]|uniref:SusC/RagA family TonB-linked outer membrane protein n=1 Tax=Alistipes sp. TaxID=1872444 RepID=UPI003AF0585C
MGKIYRSISRCLLLFAAASLLPLYGLAAEGQRGEPAVQAAKRYPIHGIVRDETGSPMVGAAIACDKGDGCITNSEGRFSIVVDSPNQTLTVSYLGYEPFVFVPGNRTSFDIALQPEANFLDDVVVIGYGSRNRRSLTSSVSSMKKDDVATLAPVSTSVQDLLGGSVKGVQVTQSSGALGSVAKINIRGVTSPVPNMTSGVANNAPLYVIDGVPQFVDDTQAINPLQTLSPNEIESIDILKDASATAIYGSRGANGVIIVNTKSGHRGDRASVEFGYTLSVANPVKTYDPLNNAEYLALQTESLKGAAAALQEGMQYGTLVLDSYYAEILYKYGIDPDTGEFLGLNRSLYGTASTDWDKIVRNRNAVSHSYTASVRGGTDKSDYSVAFNGINQQGLYLRDKMETYSGRMAVNTQLARTVRIGALMNYSYSQRETGQLDEMYGPTRNYKYAPDRTPYAEDGSINRLEGNYIYGMEGTSQASPLGLLANRNLFENESFAASAYTDITLYQGKEHGLKFHADLSAMIFNSKSNSFSPQSTQVIMPGFNMPSTLYIGNGRTTSTSVNFRLDYDWRRNDHTLQVMGGYGSDRTHSTGSSFSFSGFPDDKVLTQPSAAREFVSGTDSALRGGLNSVYSRVSYNYAERYFAEVSLRADASSKFGINNRWGVFPAVSAGWMISSEPFLAGTDKIDELKLRASWGKTGSTNVPDFSYIQYYQVNTGADGGNIYGNNSAVVLQDFLPNPDLKWEMTSEWNVGLDFAFFDNRLFGSVDTYYRYTDGALAPAPHILESGMSQFYSNIIDMSNRGVEILLGGDIFRTKHFTWTSSVNLSLNRNKVEKLNAAQLNTALQDALVEGYPVGVVKGYLVDRISQNMEEVTALDEAAIAKGHNQGYQGGMLGVGDYIMRDLDGSGHISADDRAVVANPEPKFFGGWNNRFRYRNLTLSLLFQFSYGSEAVYESLLNDLAGSFGQSVSREVYGHTWTPERPDARYPRLVAMGNSYNSRITDRAVFDASYLRLKNLTLSYALPKSWSNRIRTENISLYFTATNLFTVTSWPGIDPETVGAMVIDMGSNDDPYPLSRSFMFGVNLKF